MRAHLSTGATPMRYPTDTTLADLVRAERVLPGRLACGAHGTVRLDATGHSTREATANAVRSVLIDHTVYADGPRGCTVVVDEADAKEWLATHWPDKRPEAWDIGGVALARWSLENATLEAADRIRRNLTGLRVGVVRNTVVARVAR